MKKLLLIIMLCMLLVSCKPKEEVDYDYYCELYLDETIDQLIKAEEYNIIDGIVEVVDENGRIWLVPNGYLVCTPYIKEED